MSTTPGVSGSTCGRAYPLSANPPPCHGNRCPASANAGANSAPQCSHLKSACRLDPEPVTLYVDMDRDH